VQKKQKQLYLGWIKDENEIFERCFKGFFSEGYFNQIKESEYLDEDTHSKLAIMEFLSPWNQHVKAKRRQYGPNAEISLPVRLILTHMPQVEMPQNILFGTLVDKLSVWGLTHAALQVGPIVLDWTVDGLCIPHTFSEGHALCCVELNKRIYMNDIALIKKLCARVAEWNRNMHYGHVSYCFLAHLAKYGNCQAFVADLIHVLGLSIPGNNVALLDFLKSLRNNDSFPSFEGHTFKSHRDLDNFWIKMNNVTADKLQILFAIDRAFVLRGEERDEHCPYSQLFPISQKICSESSNRNNHEDLFN